MADRDPNDFVVLPNSFVDGWSGREVKAGYNGEPRIKCMSSGNFQQGAGTATATVLGVSGVTINTFSADGGTSPRPVSADGFIRVGLPNPPTYPNGQVTSLAPGSSWPPSFWPTLVTQPSLFEPDLQPKLPTWSVTTPDPDDEEEEAAFLLRCKTSLTGQGISDDHAAKICQAQWDASEAAEPAAAPLAAPATTRAAPPPPEPEPPPPTPRSRRRW